MIAIALLGFLVTGSEPNFSNKNILAIHKRNQAKYSKGLGNTKQIFSFSTQNPFFSTRARVEKNEVRM